MKAEHVVGHTGHYVARVLPVNREPNGPMAPARLYRNRVRLNATETLYETYWCGVLEEGDLLEADCELDVQLDVRSMAID